MRSLASLTGLLAASVALVQITLIARVPFIEKKLGQSQLIRIHGLAGVALPSLVVAHVAAVALGRPAGDLPQVVARLVVFTVTQPTLTLAAAGTVLLLVIAATSVGTVRHWFRNLVSYERWHQVHLVAYLAVLLSIPHQLVFGDSFQQAGWVRVFWLGSFVLVYGCVLVFRVGLPLWRSWYYKPYVTEIVPEIVAESPKKGPWVTTFVIAGRRSLNALGFKAGHFGIFRFRDGKGWITGHPFSVSANPNGRLMITVKHVDQDRWAEMREGTRVDIEGPFGRLPEAAEARRKVALLAAGTGITPMHALLQVLAPGAVLLYRFHSKDKALWCKELLSLAGERGVEIVLLDGRRRWRGSWLPQIPGCRSDSTALRQLIPDITNCDVYICGPPDWVRAVKRAAIRVGVPRRQIHIERFSW